MFSKHLSLLLSLTAITVVTSATSAFAQVTNSADAGTMSAENATNAQPVPGKTTTSAAALQPAPSTESQPQTTSSTPQSPDSKVAQIPIIEPGRATRSGSSYVGVAGNIGLGGGNSSLGSGNFAVISKIGLTRAFSVRPAAVIGSNTTILIPVTYDLNLQPVDPLTPARFAPYVGAGIAFNTSGTDTVGLLVSGGIDVPLTSDFTATAGVNAAFRNRTDLGLLVGVGYNFHGF